MTRRETASRTARLANPFTWGAPAEGLQPIRGEAAAHRARPPSPALSTLGVEEMAAVLGVVPAALSPECVRRIETLDFAHTPLTGAAREDTLDRVMAILDGDLAVSGPERLAVWERGWGDILARFEASGGDPAALTPHYFKPGPMRLDGRYVQPRDPRFELNFVAVLHAWLAGGVLADASTVWELGCGPGHNLVGLAALLPGTRFVGLDWATPSQEILGRVRTALGIDVRGKHVDLFAPDPGLHLDAGAAVVTIGAMEQLGSRFAPFLEWLLRERPSICVHVEPLHETYDRTMLFDELAARYAEKRGYLQGYLPALRALAAAGRIEILHVKRHLGSMMHDGWGTIVWRPLPVREVA